MIPAPVIAHRCDFRRPFTVLQTIKIEKLDILVDCTSWPRLTALLSALSGAHTVGFATPGQHRHHAYDLSVPHDLGRHESSNRAALAHALTGRDVSHSPALLPAATELPALPYDRLVLCHVSPGGSRAQEKFWPGENWASLIQQLAAEGWAFGFTGVAQDAPAISAILQKAGLPSAQAFSLAGKLNFSQLALALQRARLLITVDTATVHLGSALDVPMIALHGPSASRRWGAISSRATSLDAPHPAAGFIHFGYETHPEALAIMPTITADRVLAAARGILTDKDRPA
jgi:ADP-heptose:LPS heptosyltransferase